MYPCPVPEWRSSNYCWEYQVRFHLSFSTATHSLMYNHPAIQKSLFYTTALEQDNIVLRMSSNYVVCDRIEYYFCLSDKTVFIYIHIDLFILSMTSALPMSAWYGGQSTTAMASVQDKESESVAYSRCSGCWYEEHGKLLNV